MKVCRSISNALRCALLLGLVGAMRVLAQSSASASMSIGCGHHQGDDQHGDSDDDDDDGENDDPNDRMSSSWSWSFCGTATATASVSGGSASSSGAARGGGNADISTNGSHISKGSIAGIVIAILVALILASYLLCFIRRRYARKRRLANRPALLGPAFVTSSHPAGTKEGAGAQMQAQTMANVAPARPPGLQRTASRSTLPPIPFDTPAYTSTDNLASLSLLHAHSQSHRGSTALSYSTPSESTGVTAATAGHGSGHGSGYGYGVGAGYANLHEGMLSRQKELESSYRRMEMGQLADHPATGGGGATDLNYATGTGNLPEHPPPQYNE